MNDDLQDRTIGSAEPQGINLEECKGAIHDVSGEVALFKLCKIAASFQQVVCGSRCGAAANSDIGEDCVVGSNAEKICRTCKNFADLTFGIVLKTKRTARKARTQRGRKQRNTGGCRDERERRQLELHGSRKVLCR